MAALHKDEWQAMTPEQKIAETEEDLEELKQLKITHKYAPHNTARGTLNDTQASLRRMEKEVSADRFSPLCSRVDGPSDR